MEQSINSENIFIQKVFKNIASDDFIKNYTNLITLLNNGYIDFQSKELNNHIIVILKISKYFKENKTKELYSLFFNHIKSKFKAKLTMYKSNV